MNNDQSPSVRDARLWRRLLLVGSAGALPLFVVALLLINVAYSDAIAFGEREQQGNAFERKLESLLQTLLDCRRVERRAAAGEAPPTELPRARERVWRALSDVTTDGSSPPGHRLRFASTPGQPETPSVDWVRQEIARTGDAANLVLDHDLDSYYLMDITLGTLPQAQERIDDIASRVGAWLAANQTRANSTQIAVMVSLLREDDLARVHRDTERSIASDAAFNGASPSLARNLRPAVRHFELADEALADLLSRIAAGETPPPAAVEAAGAEAHAASFELFRAGSSELDQLLSLRLRTIRGRRQHAYWLIVVTLLGAAAVMGWVIRGLLATRYAEILKTQEELRAKEAQLRALGDNLPGGMTYQVMREADGSMRFLYVSAGVERLHGVTAAEALADPSKLYGLLSPEDLPALAEAERESLAKRTPFRIVARSRAPDGSMRWFELSSAPRDMPGGRVVWDGIQTDITERHLAELATHESQRRFAQIFDHSPIPITLNSLADGSYLAANDSYLDFSGFSREEVIGHTPAELAIYADVEQRAQVLQQLSERGYVHGFEQVFRTKSGALRSNLLWAEPLTVGSEPCVLVMSLDVTDQKAAARQQRELEEQLRQAQKLDALGTLAGGIAHDFNNILGAIISYTELSKLDNPGNAPLRQYLDEILGASRRATILVRQILSFSRQQKETRQNLQLAPIVKEALSLLRATLPTTIALQQDIDAVVAPVLANPTQVHQIVMNLCTNAAHAMKGQQGQISVSIAAFTLRAGAAPPHVELQPGAYVRLTVSDTGSGMDAATAQRIFEPFFTTKKSGEGTGLGLSVVHGIVKEYAGVVTVESEPGRGTSFAIYLPASGAVGEVPAPESLDTPTGQGQRILIVDDEAVLAEATQKVLQRLGYRAVVFQRSAAALEAFRGDPGGFDALITDLTMPELTGADLIRQVRAVRPPLPVILVSGSSGPLSPDDLRELGIRQLLSKPLNVGTLARALQQALRG